MSRSFGQMIREARLERHLSMGQLAAAVDRSTASVRRWERDDGLPAPDVIDTLVLRLGLDSDEVEEALVEARGEPVETDEPRPVDEGDPIDVVPLADVAGPVDEPIGPVPTPAPVVAAAARPPPTVWPTASVPVAVVEQDQNLLQIIRDPDRPWLGLIGSPDGITIGSSSVPEPGPAAAASTPAAKALAAAVIKLSPSASLPAAYASAASPTRVVWASQ